MTDLLIRDVTSADLPELLEMVQALAQHHGDAPQVTLADLRRDCLGDAPWLRVLVAARAGQMLGYAALCPLAQMQFGVRGMDMHHLFVVPQARGIGVGRRLIEASLTLARKLECRYMTVGTHPDNHAAGAVYQAMAFQPLPPSGPRFRIRL